MTHAHLRTPSSAANGSPHLVLSLRIDTMGPHPAQNHEEVTPLLQRETRSAMTSHTKMLPRTQGIAALRRIYVCL